MIPGHTQLRDLSKIRLKTVRILIEAEDWDAAGYMMGYVLEYALKAAVCRTLRLPHYPSGGADKSHFWTHKFDRLLTVSGLQDLFGSGEAFHYVWSEFTKHYEGEWTMKRYDMGYWKEKTVKELYTHLTDTSDANEGILSVIKRKKRW